MSQLKGMSLANFTISRPTRNIIAPIMAWGKKIGICFCLEQL